MGQRGGGSICGHLVATSGVVDAPVTGAVGAVDVEADTLPLLSGNGEAMAADEGVEYRWGGTRVGTRSKLSGNSMPSLCRGASPPWRPLCSKRNHVGDRTQPRSCNPRVTQRRHGHPLVAACRVANGEGRFSFGTTLGQMMPPYREAHHLQSRESCAPDLRPVREKLWPGYQATEATQPLVNPRQIGWLMGREKDKDRTSRQGSASTVSYWSVSRISLDVQPFAT
jgi:hypothetical protein